MTKLNFINLFRRTKPTKVYLDVCTICQLNCPTCYMRRTNYGQCGRGYVSSEQFAKFLTRNKFIKAIELSNNGEVFLNPDIAEIFRIGFEKNVRLQISGGTNFNNVSDAALEALVKYKVMKVLVSIDGASNETYSKYRIGGNFDTVIENIKKLNKIKVEYKSEFPYLTWQYVILPTNDSVEEILRAKKIAEELGMKIVFKRDWNNHVPKNSIAISCESGLTFIGEPSADLKTISSAALPNQYMCKQLWQAPQINWDGRLLGCCCNTWNDFGVNVFKKGVGASSGILHKTKRMLMGGRIVPNSPCAECYFFKQMMQTGNFITRDDLKRIDW